MSDVAIRLPVSTAECIQAMTEIIVEQFQPERIILFGSQARGDADARSDVDLLVVMPGDVDRRQTAIAITRALHHLTVPMDIIVTTTDEIVRRGHIIGTILRPALREGKVLYDHS